MMTPEAPANLTRTIAFAMGWICVILGLVGLALPLLPSTIFFILAAGFFARSSPALERRLLDHPRIGPSIRLWREYRAIPRKAKVFAVLGIAIGFAVFLWQVNPNIYLGAVTFFVLAAVAFYLVSRPDGPTVVIPPSRTSPDSAADRHPYP